MTERLQLFLFQSIIYGLGIFLVFGFNIQEHFIIIFMVNLIMGLIISGAVKFGFWIYPFLIDFKIAPEMKHFYIPPNGSVEDLKTYLKRFIRKGNLIIFHLVEDKKYSKTHLKKLFCPDVIETFDKCGYNFSINKHPSQNYILELFKDYKNGNI